MTARIKFCDTCRFVGRIPDPDRAWWQFWKRITCPDCGGDGFSKPPGWPNQAEMDRLRPPPPSGQGGAWYPPATSPPPPSPPAPPPPPARPE